MGYYIFHPASGNFVEYAPEAPSPYLGQTGKLLYGGPTNYYVPEAKSYRHTVIPETLSSEEGTWMRQAGMALRQELLQNKNQPAVNYVEGAAKTRAAVPKAVAAKVSDKLVSGAGHISKLNTQAKMGYKGGGYCGYIAGSMLMYYWQMRAGGNYVPSGWYNSSGLTGTNLTNELIKLGKGLGYGNSTNPSKIKAVLDRHQGIEPHTVFRGTAHAIAALTPLAMHQALPRAAALHCRALCRGKLEDHRGGIFDAQQGRGRWQAAACQGR